MLDDIADLGKTRLQCLELQRQRELVVERMLRLVERQRDTSKRRGPGLPDKERERERERQPQLERQRGRSRGMFS